MKSMKARKQRKALYNAPLHKKQKTISAHLEENLLLKYDRRSIPVISGDTVKIMRGAFKGHEDKVAHVHVKDMRVEVEGATITKADGKKIAKPLHPSNLLITKLNLTDKWRRENLESKVSAETRKEIEAEAKQQLREAEEERKRREQEEARQAAEEERQKEESSEEPEEVSTEEAGGTEEPVASEEEQVEKSSEGEPEKEEESETGSAEEPEEEQEEKK